MSISLFENRKLVIATKHEKEKVIAPLLEKDLGVSCFINKDLDTDIFGTFSGEIERELDPISTVRKKCLYAMEVSDCDLGVASEGSFGAHPSLFFARANEEFLILIDKKNDLEILSKELSTATNFEAKEVNTEEELIEFAKSVKFPTHGLILRRSKQDTTQMIKGITNLGILKRSFNKLMEKSNSVYAETDMRAMYNPTRMSLIEKATRKLIDKVNSPCPGCNTPGFEVTEAKKGLKCSLCGSPTDSTLSHIYSCKKCRFTKEEMYPHKKTAEDPMYCDYCNP